MILSFTPLQFILLLLLFSFSLDGISSGLLFLKTGRRFIGNLLVLVGLLTLTGFSVLLCYALGKPLLFGVVLLGVEAVVVTVFLTRYFVKIASNRKRFMDDGYERIDGNNDANRTCLSPMEESEEAVETPEIGKKHLIVLLGKRAIETYEDGLAQSGATTKEQHRADAIGHVRDMCSLEPDDYGEFAEYDFDTEADASKVIQVLRDANGYESCLPLLF